MKALRNLILVSLLALFAMSCGNNQSHAEDHSDHSGHAAEMQDAKGGDKTGPEWTSAYVCPMHCEGSGSDEPGKCPVCGMEYVENKM